MFLAAAAVVAGNRPGISASHVARKILFDSTFELIMSLFETAM